MAVLPGKTLERYELLNRIAVGGMAEVYRAVAYGAHGFEKTLAIKRILPELARDPEFEARFIAEAKVSVQLTHANIVQVFDFGRFAGTMFIAMEFVDGLDLAALIKRGRERGERIPIPAAFQIAIEIARGLDFAHQHNVVHRDVSPSNILLSKAGEVKIADFGIAQAATERPGRPSGRRRIMGKWRYMSPEQTQGENLSTRSDIFSAASVLFELFTGDKLCRGDEAEQVIENIHNMKIPSAAERRPGLPPSLDAVLARCLARDPEDRPGKPGEVVRALTEISYESSIVATALDVAEAVRGSIPEEVAAEGSAPVADRRAGIDDLIRKQLGGAAPDDGDVRRTAVGTEVSPERRTEADAPEPGGPPTHTATVVRKGVDADGVTVWEIAGDGAGDDDGNDVDDGAETENTIAAVPSAIRLGKSTGNLRALAEEPSVTGGEAKAEPAASSRLPLLAIAALLLIGGAVATWALTRGGEEVTGGQVPVVSAADAAPVAVPGPPLKATLVLDSVPQGARVWVDGVLLPSPTPTSAEVDPEIAHEIQIEADGYVRWSLRDVRVEAGKSFPIKPRLVGSRARLAVVTKPSGALVELEGDRLGATPVERGNLEPGRAALVIKKRGYQTLRENIELLAGEVVTIERTLVAKIARGTIRIAVPGWAEVYFRGKKVGTVPRQRITLPVGRHKLKLANPQTGKQKSIDVDVAAGEERVFRVNW